MNTSNHPANGGSNWNGNMDKIRRTALYLRAGLTCAACGRSALSGADRASLSLDHVVAVSLGGSNDSSNLVVLCVRCNSSKGSQDLTAWLARGGHPTLSLCAAPATVERRLRAQAAQDLTPFHVPAAQIVSARRRQLQHAKAA